MTRAAIITALSLGSFRDEARSSVASGDPDKLRSFLESAYRARREVSFAKEEDHILEASLRLCLLDAMSPSFDSALKNRTGYSLNSLEEAVAKEFQPGEYDRALASGAFIFSFNEETSIVRPPAGPFIPGTRSEWTRDELRRVALGGCRMRYRVEYEGRELAFSVRPHSREDLDAIDYLVDPKNLLDGVAESSDGTRLAIASNNTTLGVVEVGPELPRVSRNDFSPHFLSHDQFVMVYQRPSDLLRTASLACFEGENHEKLGSILLHHVAAGHISYALRDDHSMPLGWLRQIVEDDLVDENSTIDIPEPAAGLTAFQKFLSDGLRAYVSADENEKTLIALDGQPALLFEPHRLAQKHLTYRGECDTFVSDLTSNGLSFETEETSTEPVDTSELDSQAQKMVRELARDLLKKRLEASHEFVQLSDLRHDSKTYFDQLEARKTLLLLRKKEPVGELVPDLANSKGLKCTRTNLVAQGKKAILGPLALGKRFIVERADTGGGNVREVGVLRAAPKLTPKEVSMIRESVKKALDHID